MIINFDNSATTFPKPLSVRKAVSYAMEHYGGNAGRGGHQLSMATSQAVFRARETIADFFDASPENVIFTLNCTYALNLAIRGVMTEGGHLIISSLEHNSSARPATELAMNKRIALSVATVIPAYSTTSTTLRVRFCHTRSLQSLQTTQYLLYCRRSSGVRNSRYQALSRYKYSLHFRTQGTVRHHRHGTSCYRREIPN